MINLTYFLFQRCYQLVMRFPQLCLMVNQQEVVPQSQVTISIFDSFSCLIRSNNTNWYQIDDLSEIERKRAKTEEEFSYQPLVYDVVYMHQQHVGSKRLKWMRSRDKGNIVLMVKINRTASACVCMSAVYVSLEILYLNAKPKFGWINSFNLWLL